MDLRLWPHLRCVKHAQNSQHGRGLCIHNNIVRPDYQLAGSVDTANSAAFWMSWKLLYLALDFIHQGQSRVWIIVRDIIDYGQQVFNRRCLPFKLRQGAYCRSERGPLA